MKTVGLGEKHDLSLIRKESSFLQSALVFVCVIIGNQTISAYVVFV